MNNPENRTDLISVSDLTPAAERKLVAFESAWRKEAASAPSIESFLDEGDIQSEPALLEELVRVDMELRAKRAIPFSVKDYLQRFPVLRSLKGAVDRIESEAKRLSGSSAKSKIDANHRPSQPRPSQLRPSQPRPSQPRPFPEVPAQFLGFELIGILGEGAFGRVYLARQGDLARRLVALKITTVRTHEAQRLAQLQHTNIVPIYSQHEMGDWQAICMPFLGVSTFADLIPTREKAVQSSSISGRELISTLANRKPLTIPMLADSSSVTRIDQGAHSQTRDQVSDVMFRETQPKILFEAVGDRNRDETYAWLWQQTATGLAFAHGQGVIHGDVKPANILISERGYPKLLDFNLAIQRDEHQSNLVGGTVPYASAEHIQAIRSGKKVDERSDLYSLGVVFYQLLTGELPFASYAGRFEENANRLIEDRRNGAIPIRHRLPDLNPNLAAIVDKAIDGSADRQYQSASELSEDLQRFLDYRPLRFAANNSIRQRIKNWIRRHPRITSASSVAAIALVLLGSIGVIAYATWQKNIQFQIAEETRGWIEEVRKARQPFSSDLNPSAFASRVENLERLIKEPPAVVVANTKPANASLSPTQQMEAEKQLAASHLDLADAFLRQGFKDHSAVRKELIDKVHQHHQWVQKNYPERTTSAGFVLQQSRLAELSGEIDRAKQLREQGREMLPIDTVDRKLLANELLLLGEVQLAGTLLEQGVEADGTDFEAWLLLGNAWFRQDRLGESEACFTICLSLEPDSEFATYSRARVRYQQGKLDGAKSDYTRAIKLNPPEPVYWSDRALVEMALNQWSEARQDLTEAMSLPGVEPRAFYLRHLTHTAMGMEKESAEDLKTFLEKKPTDDDGWAFRGGAYLQQGDRKQALSDIEQALKANPRSATALQNYAAILAQDPDQTDDAIQAMTKLIELEPTNPTHIVTRGVLLARVENREGAHRDAEKAIQLDPTADTRYRAAGIYSLTSKNNPEDRKKGISLIAMAMMEQPQVVLKYIDDDPDIDALKQEPAFLKLIDSLRAIQAQTETK